MRMIGHVKGAPVTTATRRSVILSWEGMELLFTPCVAPSRAVSGRPLAAPRPAAAAPSFRKKDRRPPRSRTLRFMITPRARGLYVQEATLGRGHERAHSGGQAFCGEPVGDLVGMHVHRVHPERGRGPATECRPQIVAGDARREAEAGDRLRHVGEGVVALQM